MHVTRLGYCLVYTDSTLIAPPTDDCFGCTIGEGIEHQCLNSSEMLGDVDLGEELLHCALDCVIASVSGQFFLRENMAWYLLHDA